MTPLTQNFAEDFEKNSALCPGDYNPTRLFSVLNERRRFSNVCNLVTKLNVVADRYAVSNLFTHHYFINCSHLNDGLAAVAAIYYAIVGKYNHVLGDKIVDMTADRDEAEGGIVDMITGYRAGANTAEDDEECPMLFIYQWTNEQVISKADINGVKIIFVIYCENDVPAVPDRRGFIPIMGAVPVMQTRNKSSARQAALDLHYTYIDIPEESSSELADYITDYFHRHKFNTSKVKKQIKELAELPCVKDEYTAVASARNVLNTHISRLNECPGLMTSDFSDYLGMSTKKSGRPGLNENNSLVGLKDEQEKLTNAVNSLILEQSRRKLGLPDTNTGCNLVFAGSPGTAKTTLARVFAKSLAENGLIPSAENFKECRKSDIVGMYVGHTAAMVDRLFEEMHRAGGGVIFFDEIYTLSEDNNTCFDKEAINCITQNMENYRTTVYCIFAGYKNKMKQFINANPGLSSRISETIIFEDYSDSTLCSIFENMLAAQSFTVEGEHEKYLRKYFSRLREEKGESFGNGREARNLFEASKRIMAARVVPGKARSKAALSTIMPEEIKAAGDSLLSSVLGNENMPVIGF